MNELSTNTSCMNERQYAKYIYLKRLCRAYLMLLPQFDNFKVEFDEKTNMVKVKFYKTVLITTSIGKVIPSENKAEDKFIIGQIGRVTAMYKRNLKDKFKNRKQWNG